MTPLILRARDFCTSDRVSRLHNLLSSADQAKLSSIAKVLEYPRGNMRIFSEGEPLEAVYAVAHGVVRISQHARSGERRVMGFMWPGDVFGLAEVGAYVNSADTLTRAAVFRLPIAEFRHLLLREPELEMKLLIKATHDLRVAQHHLIVAGQANSLRQVASFLVDMSQQLDVFDASSGEMKLPVSRADMADYLGLATETISRDLKKLEDHGYIERKTNHLLCVKNMPGLIRFSHAFGAQEPRPA